MDDLSIKRANIMRSVAFDNNSATTEQLSRADDLKMTGTEWFTAFKKEIGNYPLANTVNINNHALVFTDVIEAAKIASGIIERNK